MTVIAESIVEETAIGWLQELGWTALSGEDVAPNPDSLRSGYKEAMFPTVLHGAVERLNPDLPEDAIEDACRRLIRSEGATLEARNRDFHYMLVDGVQVEYRDADGEVRGTQARVVDFEHPDKNIWHAANQFTIIEGESQRRPDIVLFVNGLPLVVMELKSPASQSATAESAWKQLQTYKAELPTLFAMNALLVVSDGIEARVGTLTSGWEWFRAWHTDCGGELPIEPRLPLRTLVHGLFEKKNFLSILRDYMLFEDDGSGAYVKKMAGYHQFYAAEGAVYETLRAAELPPEERTAEHEIDIQGRTTKAGDRRIGVVWHTQGSGKSLTMAFFAGRIIREPAMANPTVVVLTDRNDLDDQLFGTFSHCEDLLRQTPVQAESRADLRTKLAVESGGVVFTTIQKFFPEEKSDQHPVLSERRNIVVIADEAHRSQYDFLDGYARHMRDALPHASFIGFTATPLEVVDANTRAVFGDYISIYDIQRAVDDKMTVPIYYESRLAKLELDENERPTVDPDFEEATEGEEIERKEKLKTRWARMAAIVGAEKRLQHIAHDLVTHFEDRLKTMKGKAMVVCMSRRICIDLYQELAKLRPDWCCEDDARGSVKVVMTGSASDGPDWQEHIRNKPRREKLAARFRDPNDPFQIVLVRDMWLTGFDAPSLHTMYIDKPMRGHGLMQAIARVNRVFRDKPGGLIVDYLGLANELKKAAATYTESGGAGSATLNQEDAVAVMLEKYEICQGLMHGLGYPAGALGTERERMEFLPAALEYVLAQKNGKKRFVHAVHELSQAFALAVPHEEALRIRDELAFFQAVRSVLAKRQSATGRSEDELDRAVREIVGRTVESKGILDIFDAAGLAKPDVSILSDEFLEEVRNMPQRNLAVELLQKLLKGEIARQRRKNVVKARSFAHMLETTILRYNNQTVEAAVVIAELIEIAQEIREANSRGEELGLSQDELAFYDALGTNDSAVQVLGDEKLRVIACELVQTVKDNVTIDWSVRENVRAKLRLSIKRILRKYGYPPDKAEKATKTVLEQAEILSDEWLRDPSFGNA